MKEKTCPALSPHSVEKRVGVEPSPVNRRVAQCVLSEGKISLKKALRKGWFS
jgi:hypothetical protein